LSWGGEDLGGVARGKLVRDQKKSHASARGHRQDFVVHCEKKLAEL